MALGAGISRDIAPDWADLARQLLDQAFGSPIADDVFGELSKLGWPLDGLIQAAANRFLRSGSSIEQFDDMIEECLYSRLRTKARGLGLEKYLTAVLNQPKHQPKERVIEVCDFLEATFPKCSLFATGRFLIRAAKQKRGPRAILTFNADTFLETYMDLFLRREHYQSPPPHGHPAYYFVSVQGSGGGSGNKIPLYHCHGSIAPRVHSKSRDRRDRLVFLEQEYLAMSSKRAAWAETAFLFHAQTTKMAFCGMSMSDMNVRRWMSSTEEQKHIDRAHFSTDDAVNPEHVWIRQRPKIAAAEEIILSSLLHLGVRPAWLDSWSELEHSLANLAALD